MQCVRKYGIAGMIFVDLFVKSINPSIIGFIKTGDKPQPLNTVVLSFIVLLLRLALVKFSMVRDGIKVSVRIRVSLVLVIYWRRTSRHGLELVVGNRTCRHSLTSSHFCNIIITLDDNIRINQQHRLLYFT